MKGLAVAVVTVAVAAATPAPATATPATGTEVAILSQNTVDGVEYAVTRITVAPGGGTGWHFHPGDVFGYIAEGSMTHYGPDCTVDAVYPTGAPVKEGVGPGFVHNGRNEGGTPLVMEVVYVNPVGAPKSVEVAEPIGCRTP